MSENTNKDRVKIYRLAYGLSYFSRALLHLQKNNNLAADLPSKGTPKNEETNPMDYRFPNPKLAILQLLATTSVTLTTKPKFAIFGPK